MGIHEPSQHRISAIRKHRELRVGPHLLLLPWYAISPQQVQTHWW